MPVSTFSIRQAAAISAIASALVAAAPASAQQIESSWRFTPQNRASIAVAVKQMKEQRETSVAVAEASAPKSTSIVCGGGSSTSTANNTCIILNEATGEIITDQAAEGSNQTATNQVEKGTNADEILRLLGQN